MLIFSNYGTKMVCHSNKIKKSTHSIFYSNSLTGVAPTILHLLQCAIVSNAAAAATATTTTTKKTESSTKPTTSSRKDREKSDDSVTESLFDETNCVTLVEQINQQIPKEVFAGFVKTFLLETNATSVRWQAHALVYAIYK